MEPVKVVGVFVGSLRKDSVNKKVARAIATLAPKQLSFHFLDISRLPFFNEDLEQSPPAEWVAFRNEVHKCDALLFVTPEYNRSMPAVLKNAIDVASRPYGQSVLNGLPGAVVSASPGAVGGFGANHHLRQSLVFLNVPAMQQPEIYLNNAFSLFDERGELKNDSTKKLLQGFGESFAKWIHRFDKASNEE